MYICTLFHPPVRSSLAVSRLKQMSYGVSCRSRLPRSGCGLPGTGRRAQSLPSTSGTAVGTAPNTCGPTFRSGIVNRRYSIRTIMRHPLASSRLRNTNPSVRTPGKPTTSSDLITRSISGSLVQCAVVGVLQEHGESYRCDSLFHLPLQSRESSITCITPPLVDLAPSPQEW